MATSTDWLNRVVLPDVYPRRDDPFQPPAAMVVPGSTASTPVPSAGQGTSVDIYGPSVTQPGQRPVVYQRALNFNVTANPAPIALTNGQFQCDTILLNVYSSVAGSAFFGFGNGISPAGGGAIEVRPGLPMVITPDNTREFWELQRALEAISAMMAAYFQIASVGTFRAPRVVFNASDYYICAAAATTVAVMLFNVPELQ